MKNYFGTILIIIRVIIILCVISIVVMVILSQNDEQKKAIEKEKTPPSYTVKVDSAFIQYLGYRVQEAINESVFDYKVNLFIYHAKHDKLFLEPDSLTLKTINESIEINKDLAVQFILAEIHKYGSK